MGTMSENEFLELYSMALHLEKEKKTEAAIHAYEELIDMKDDFFESYIKLGMLYETINQDLKAREVYRKGIRKAKYVHNSTANDELSYTLLGLLD